MAKAKFKIYVERMLNAEKKVLESFRVIHDNYALDNEKWQDEFNKEGEKVLEIVREWEDRLCRDTERGMYSNFSTKLAEKFQAEVKKHFPMIDHVGIKISYETSSKDFVLKKITLL